MKKTLLFLFALIGFTTANYAQNISIVGSGVNGWPPDNNPEIVLSTTDNIIYTIEDLVVSTGEVKFRENMAWTNNWGGSGFPSGTGVFNSSNNIPTVAGTYDVTFNKNTLEYSFVGTSAFPSIGIIGTVLGEGGFDGADVDMITSDGENYILSAYTLLGGELKFRQDNAWTINWGNNSNAFPSGIAMENEGNISVPGGTYTINFNRLTGAYSFDFVSIGFLGTVLGEGGFEGADVDLTTTDGVIYSITNYPLAAGELKFRQDNSWAVNWGGDTMSGTASQNGNNITVTISGNYDITFNKSSLEYSIITDMATEKFATKNIKVYPNPSNTTWNFSSPTKISTIQIVDIVGKIVLTKEVTSSDFTIDASDFPNGMYFAKISTDHNNQIIKVIKN